MAAWSRIGFLAKHFKRKGNEVTVAGIFNILDKNKITKKESDGVRILNVIPIVMRFDIFSFIFNFLSVIFTSWISFIIVRPDIVIISVPPGESALCSFILAKLFRTKKIIFDYRDEWEDYYIKTPPSILYKIFYKLLKRLITRCYLNSDLVVTVTERLAEELSSRGIKDVMVISNGADINIFRPQSKLKKNNFRQNIGLRDNDFVLVFCGTIGGYYRIDILIKSLKNVNQKLPNVKLLLVGIGPDLKNILNLIDSLEMRESVLYLGVKSDEFQIVEILSASDVGIIPYDSNPLWKNAIPVKSLEYLACGLPIIATLDSNSVLGRLVMENQVGMLCEPENVLELSKIIEKVYHDKVFVENASKRAISLIHTHFDRNKLAEEYYHIIK